VSILVKNEMSKYLVQEFESTGSTEIKSCKNRFILENKDGRCGRKYFTPRPQ